MFLKKKKKLVEGVFSYVKCCLEDQCNKNREVAISFGNTEFIAKQKQCQ